MGAQFATLDDILLCVFGRCTRTSDCSPEPADLGSKSVMFFWHSNDFLLEFRHTLPQLCKHQRLLLTADSVCGLLFALTP